MLAAPARATPPALETPEPPSCLEGLRIRAEQRDASALLTQLKHGRLSRVSRAECADATVHLATVDGAWRVGLERGGKHVTRDAATLQLASMWLETWLEPTSTDEGPARLERDVAPRPDPTDAPAPPPVSAPAPDRPALPTQAALAPRAGLDAAPRAVGAVSFGGAASRWVGSGLVVRLSATERLWAGPELEALWNTEPGPARRWLQAGAAFGVRLPLSKRVTLWPSLSVGVASVGFDTGAETASSSGPYAGAGCDVGVALVDRLSLVAGVGARRLFTDTVRVTTETALTPSGREAGENDADDQRVRLVSSELERPTFAASAQLGLSLTLGGSP